MTRAGPDYWIYELDSLWVLYATAALKSLRQNEVFTVLGARRAHCRKQVLPARACTSLQVSQLQAFFDSA